MKYRINSLIAIILIAAFIGCSKDKNSNPTPPANSFRIVATVTGAGADSTMSGSATFTVTNDSTVTGVFHVVQPAVSSHNLTGLYVNVTNVLAASGDGYNFSGILDDTTGLFRGVVTGAANGLVLGASDDNNSSVAYCGTFTGDDSGTWNFTIEGTTIYGSHTTGNGSAEELTGTISGNVITLYEDGDQVGAGTRSGDNVSGTWDDGNGDSGTWSGSRCN